MFNEGVGPCRTWGDDMITDQVESLTRDTADTRHVLDSLPVQSSEAAHFKDLLAKDHPETENSLVKGVLTVMTWVTYALALGAVVLLTRAIMR